MEKTNYAFASTTSAAGGYASAQIAKPQKPIPELAERLHSLASNLGDYNERLEAALNRLGLALPPGGVSAGDKSPEPVGALMVAQFGAQRIRNQMDALQVLIVRLEEAI